MDSFKPAFGLKNRHIQTLYPALYRKIKPLDLENEIFELDDGDFTECSWYKKPKKDETKPIVVLLHGLEGSYKSPYIKGIMLELDKIGFSSVLMHFRGCGDTSNRYPRAYHSGDTKDIRDWIKYLKMTYPLSDLFAVGYSLGGNVLLKLLGEDGKDSHLKGAVSVSAPIQLDISANAINKGYSKIYQKHLLKHLKQTLLNKYENHPMKSLINFDKKNIDSIDTIHQFDEIYTAKIHNFENAQEYYKKSSAKQYLKYIKTPTLIIQALDDPFMTKNILPSKDELSNSITLEVYENGGHVGFVSGTIFQPQYWLEGRFVEYFEKFK
ncbi:MAG: hydrolase [Campylobacterota bacterium]|nr:hydrolase [Campylobacterota bacterium]